MQAQRPRSFFSLNEPQIKRVIGIRACTRSNIEVLVIEPVAKTMINFPRKLLHVKFLDTEKSAKPFSMRAGPQKRKHGKYSYDDAKRQTNNSFHNHVL